MFATKRIKDNGGTNRPWIEISITTFRFVFLYPISFPIAFFPLETLHRPTPLITHQQFKQRREIKVNSTVRTHQKKNSTVRKGNRRILWKLNKVLNKKIRLPVYVNHDFEKKKVYIYFTFKMYKLVMHKWNIKFILSFQGVNTISTYQLW